MRRNRCWRLELMLLRLLHALLLKMPRLVRLLYLLVYLLLRVVLHLLLHLVLLLLRILLLLLLLPLLRMLKVLVSLSWLTWSLGLQRRLLPKRRRLMHVFMMSPLICLIR
jgi:hypothetical protein